MVLHENSKECSTGFIYPDEAEPDTPTDTAHPPETLEFARRLVSYVRSQTRARLTIDCLYLALGDADLEDETMTSTATRHGITKAAVSKRVAKIQDDLHLPKTFNNKSANACSRYTRTNRSPLRLDRRVQPAPSGRG